MAVSEQQQQANMNKFMAAQERARKLISSDARQEIAEGKKKSNSTLTLSESINMVSPSYANSQNYDDYEEPQPQMLGEAQMAQIHSQAKQMPIQQNTVRNNKLPKAILDAMKENPIDTSLLESQMGMERQTSVLDTMNIKPIKKQVITEASKQMTVQTPSIDYSLIKTIVEESVKKYVGSLKKTMLTENTQQKDNNLILMNIGESFKFVTSSGDIYEAKLIKKGNINEKRTKS